MYKFPDIFLQYFQKFTPLPCHLRTTKRVTVEETNMSITTQHHPSVFYSLSSVFGLHLQYILKYSLTCCSKWISALTTQQHCVGQHSCDSGSRSDKCWCYEILICCFSWLGPTHCGVAPPIGVMTLASGCGRSLRSDLQRPDSYCTFFFCFVRSCFLQQF